MTTSVVNIALNKDLGLVFLHAKPQLTASVGIESHMNDQLQVARAMLGVFLEDVKKDEALWERVVPFMDLGEYEFDTQKGRYNDQENGDQVARLISEIQSSNDSFSSIPWESEDDEVRSFRLRILKQIDQCVAYTNQRIELIKATMAITGAMEKNGGVALDTIVNDYSPSVLERITDGMAKTGFGGQLGVGILYCKVKSHRSIQSHFADEFLNFVRTMITDEAIKRGYRR